MGTPTIVDKTITQIPLRGVEKYHWFWETKLSSALREYKKGAISKDDVAELCIGRDVRQLYHIVDIWKNGEPIDRRLFRTDSTMNSLLTEAKEKGYALLYRGFFAIPRNVWDEYKQNYSTVKRLKVFKLSRLTRMAQYVLIDTDAKQGMTFEKLKKLIKYLHKLEIYPEVWESASGIGNYHIYINLVGMVERFKTRNENGVEEERRKYYLPYASDYRVSLAVEGLKELFKHLGIPYDSISTDRAVWLENFPNPEKGGRASKKIWNGKPHRLDSLAKKLQPFWERKLREEAKKEYYTSVTKRPQKTQRTQSAPANVGNIEIYEEDHSNPINYLQANVAPTFRMLDKGYTWFQIEQQLRTGWSGDQKSFDRAFKGFEAWINANYRPPKKKPKENKSNHKRKHTHYWEHIPKIYEVLQQDGLNSSLNHIHRKTQISKGTLSNIFKIVSKKQILSSPEEAQELLKAYQKGGDRMTTAQKEEARKRGKGRWEKYLDKFLEESIKARKKPLGDKGKKAPKKPFKGEALVNLKGVQIGPISITLFERKAVVGQSSFFEARGSSLEVFSFRVIPFVSGGFVKPILSEKRRKAFSLISKLENLWLRREGNLPCGVSYKKLIFGAVFAEEKRSYNLYGWGRYSKVLESVLRELGHEVVYEKKPKPGEIWRDLEGGCIERFGSNTVEEASHNGNLEEDDDIEELLDF